MIDTIDKNKVSKALVEVEAILEELSMQEYNKIPDDVIEFIYENKDMDYNWDYDYDKDLAHQELSEYTVEILAYINNQYLLDEEKKKLMERIYQLNSINEKRNIVDTEIKDIDSIFEEKKAKIKIEQDNGENKLPIIVKQKSNIFIKILDTIKSFFNIKSK